MQTWRSKTTAVLLFAIVVCAILALGRTILRPSSQSRFSSSASVADQTPRVIEKPRLIAHAGGGLGRITYSNALQALNINYERGHRFFEIDFSWTSDGHLVLLHDWQKIYQELFIDASGRLPLEDFLNARMRGGLTQLSLEGLLQWIKGHPDAYVVTDVKSDNVRALAHIRAQDPRLLLWFIPQIYSFDEYTPVAKLGYVNIILTLYSSPASDAQVVQFATNHPLFAITMPVARALRTNLAKDLRKMNVVVYAHTVNDGRMVPRLRKRGVYGIYTDFLLSMTPVQDAE